MISLKRFLGNVEGAIWILVAPIAKDKRRKRQAREKIVQYEGATAFWV